MAYKIKKLRSGGLITNYFCPSRCGHCLYACGPIRRRDYISESMAEKLLRAVKRAGCSSVHIGGGEPFADPQGLAMVLAAAGRAGVAVEYVETNAAWFQGQEAALEVLSGLRAQGLSCLLVSISPFHNQSIPAERTKGLIKACAQAGVRVFPWVPEFWPDLEALAQDKPHQPDEYERVFGPDYWQKVPGRYWVHLGGRAAYFFASRFGLEPLETILERNQGPCRELGDTSHFHVDLYGGYVPGLCAGLVFDCGLLGRDVPLEEHPALCALAEGGVHGLLAIALEKGFQPARAYLNKCHLCLEMRLHLVSTGWEHPDLGPKGFYENLMP